MGRRLLGKVLWKRAFCDLRHVGGLQDFEAEEDWGKGQILKRGSTSRSSGTWGDDDYDVLEGGVVVGRIMLSPGAPQDRPWMWASGHNGDIRRAAHGYEATREAAMEAFAKSWRGEC
jgi:hypothetical protein